MDLPDKIFGVVLSADLLHQVAASQMSNSRKVLAHTKDRSEVRGGGRKPWRQKGTGRARHGSRRSPIWVGGGITFGPTKCRNFAKKINSKMKRKAILTALSSKIRDGEIIVLDKIELSSGKTKEMAGMIEKIIEGNNSALLLLPAKNETISRAGKNIPGLKIVNISNISILDLLNYKNLILLKDSIESFRKYGTV